MTRPSRSLQVQNNDLRGVRCVGYIRVSTDQQATDDRTSLEDQRAAIIARAAKLGLTVGAWFEDRGVSGATAQKRPGFMSLVAACESQSKLAASPGVVLALNDSRFGRFPDPKEQAYWQVRLGMAGWKVRFCDGDDIADGVGRDVVRLVGAAQASEYRENLRRNTQRGMKGSTERGFWCRREPFGYRRKVILPAGRERILEPGQRKASDERVTLIPHDEEAVTVRRIFQHYDSGKHSMRSISRWLKEHAPSRIWSPHAVQIILNNGTYCGDMLSGRRSSSAEQYGKQDSHPAIINRELFARVQRRLKANREQPRRARSPWALSGLVACEHCGEPYSAGGLGSWRKDGSRTQFYMDRGGRDSTKGGKRCAGPIGTVSKHLLEGAVLDTVQAELSKPMTQRRIQAAVDRFLKSMGSSVDSGAQAARAEVAKLEARQGRLVAAIADGTLTNAEAGKQLTALRLQLDAAKQRVHESAFERRRTAVGKSERDRLVAMATDFGAAAKTLDGAELRDLLKPWLASATFDKRTRTLTVAIRRVPASAPLFTVPAPAPG